MIRIRLSPKLLCYVKLIVCVDIMKKFTLIKLLVVIAIIGILASILLPTLSKARIKGMRVVSSSNSRQLFYGTLGYVQDNDDNLPHSWIFPAVTGSNGKSWRNTLVNQNYIEDRSLLISPVQAHFSAGVIPHENYPTYSMSGHLNAKSYKNYVSVKLSQVTNLHKTMLISEGSTFGTDLWFNSSSWSTQLPEYTGDRVVMVFLDGHVEQRTLSNFPQGNYTEGSDNWYFWEGIEP